MQDAGRQVSGRACRREEWRLRRHESYTMDLTLKTSSRLDEVVEDRGVKIFIDPKAILFLIGTEMDFVTRKARALASSSTTRTRPPPAAAARACRSRRRSESRCRFGAGDEGDAIVGHEYSPFAGGGIWLIALYSISGTVFRLYGTLFRLSRGIGEENARATGKDAEPAKRADAQRNVEALLKAAMAVFAKSGVEAPVREGSRRKQAWASAPSIVISRSVRI